MHFMDAMAFRHLDIPAGVVTIAGRVLTNAVAVLGGNGCSSALLSDGTVFGWGDNYLGDAIGLNSVTEATNGLVEINGFVLSNVIAISLGGLALKSNGTVVGWGLRTDTNFIASLSNM